MTKIENAQAHEFIAFDGFRRVARGELREVARAAKSATDSGLDASLSILDARTSTPVEFDLRGSEHDVLARLAEPAPHAKKTAGRPRLGVVAREVTLLPRHWAWLADQPGGASAALRRLVDHARSTSGDRDALRHAQESAYRFMSTLLGDQADYDEAARALFAGDRDEFRALVHPWPTDARDHLLELAEAVFARVS